MKRFFAWLWALFLVGAVASAHAQGYLGAGIGLTDVDIQDDVEAILAAQGAVCGTNINCSFDEEDTGIKLFGGARINPNFAIEGFYVDFGEASVDLSGPGGTGTINAEASAFGVAALGIAPVSSNFELFGKAGFALWEADVTADVNGSTVGSSSGDGTDPFFGVGAQMDLDAIKLRAEYEMFDLDDTDIDLISISALFDF